MEPENTPLERENHLPNHHQLRFDSLIFGGVIGGFMWFPGSPAIFQKNRPRPHRPTYEDLSRITFNSTRHDTLVLRPGGFKESFKGRCNNNNNNNNNNDNDNDNDNNNNNNNNNNNTIEPVLVKMPMFCSFFVCWCFYLCCNISFFAIKQE